MDREHLEVTRCALIRALNCLLDPTTENIATALLNTTVALGRLAQKDAIAMLADAIDKAQRHSQPSSSSPLTP